LLRHRPPRRPPRARVGRGPGPVLPRPRPRPGVAFQFAQQPGRPPRTGGAAGRRPGATAGGLSRGAGPAARARVDLPGGGPPAGPQRGQRGKGLDASPGPAASCSGRCLMNLTETGPAESPPAPSAGSALDDPRVTMALKEYLAALEAGQKPDRAAF